MASGAKSKFCAPMFEPKIYCSEEVLVTLLGLFCARGIVTPLHPPRYAPAHLKVLQDVCDFAKEEYLFLEFINPFYLVNKSQVTYKWNSLTSKHIQY